MQRRTIFVFLGPNSTLQARSASCIMAIGILKSHTKSPPAMSQDASILNLNINTQVHDLLLHHLLLQQRLLDDRQSLFLLRDRLEHIDMSSIPQ
jgi:hypothetical protein